MEPTKQHMGAKDLARKTAQKEERAAQGKKGESVAAGARREAGRGRLAQMVGSGDRGVASAGAAVAQQSRGNAALAGMARGGGQLGQDGGAAAGNPQQALALAAQSKGEPLPPELRQLLEARFGYDLSVLQMHTDAKAIQAAEGLDAQAFTRGAHLYFTEKRPPVELVAHEVAHAIQQGAVKKSPGRPEGGTTGGGGSAEAQADAAGAAVAAGKSPGQLEQSGGTRVQKKGENSELSSLIQQYKRLIRFAKTMKKGQAALAKADPEVAPQIQGQIDELTALYDKHGGEAGLQKVLERIKALKGEAYAQAIVAKYESEPDLGWTFDASASATKTQSTKKTETRVGDNATGEGWDKEKEKLGQDPSVKVTEGQTPGGTPKATIDTNRQSQVKTESKTKVSEIEGEEKPTIEGKEHKLEGKGALSGTGEGHKELYQGDKADIYLDYKYLQYEGSLKGNLGAGAEMGEFLMHLKQCKDIFQAVELLKQLDPSKFKLTGEAQAAFNLLSGTLTVDGAPLPFNVGSEAMLLDWLFKVSAGAYAKIYASGAVDPDLKNLQLNASGKAGAKAVAEAGAAIITRATWMSGASPAPVAEGVVEGNVSAGASAEAYATLKVGAGVLEIAAGAGVTWGLGGSVSGKLRVSIVNALKLVAKLLGVDAAKLPDPLNKIWEAIKADGAAIKKLIDLKTWLLEKNPLKLLAQFFSAEEIQEAILALIEGGMASVDLIGWLKTQVKLGDEKTHSVTICGQTFQSAILWYVLAIGGELLEIGLEVIKPILEVAKELTKEMLRWLIKGGVLLLKAAAEMWDTIVWIYKNLPPEVIDLIAEAGKTAIDVIKLFIQIGIEQLKLVFKAAKAVGKAIFEFIAAHQEQIDAILEFIKTASEQVWGWIKKGGPALFEAFMACGKWLVEVVQALGEGVLAFLNEVAPELVAIGKEVAPQVVAAIKKYGEGLLRLVGKLGPAFVKLLSELGERLTPLWEALKMVGKEAWEDIVILFQQEIKPALELFLDLTADALKTLFTFIKAHKEEWKKLIQESWKELIQAAKEAKETLVDLIMLAIELGSWVLGLGKNLTGPTLEVLKKHGPKWKHYFQTIGKPFLDLIMEVGAELVEKLVAAYDGLAEILKKIGARVIPLVKAAGKLVLEAFDLLVGVGEKVVDWIIKKGEAFIAWAVKVGKPIYEWLKKAAETVVDLAIALGETFVELYRELKEALLDLLTKAAEPLKKIWSAFKEQVLSRAIRLAVKAGQWLLDLAAEYGPKLLDWLEVVGAAAWSWLKGQIRQVVEISFWLGGKFVDFLKEGKELIVQVAKTCYAQLKKIYAAAAELLAPAIKLIAEAGAWVADVVVTYGKKAIDLLAKAGATLLGWLKDAGKAALTFLIEIGETALEFFKKWVGEPLKQLFLKAAEKVTAIWKAYGQPALEKLLEWIKRGVEWLYDAVKELGAKVIAFVDKVVSKCWEALKKAGKAVWDTIVSAGEKVWQAVCDLGEWLIERIKLYGPKILRWIKEGLEGLTRLVGQGLGWVVDKVLSGAEAALDFAISFPDKVIAFSNTLGDLFSKILDGLKGAWSWLTSDADALRIVDSEAYKIMDPKGRGQTINTLRGGAWCTDSEQTAILEVLKYSKSAGDIGSVVGHVDGGGDAILGSLSGWQDADARNLLGASEDGSDGGIVVGSVAYSDFVKWKCDPMWSFGYMWLKAGDRGGGWWCDGEDNGSFSKVVPMGPYGWLATYGNGEFLFTVHRSEITGTWRRKDGTTTSVIGKLIDGATTPL